MRLLTNNPKKIAGLHGWGLDVIDQLALTTEPNPTNIHYLRTKVAKMGHSLEGVERSPDAPDKRE
jgi:3,4-dihydroxy 2-butanone 4-phosphate synthase/GTP cyclohydrolase II